MLIHFVLFSYRKLFQIFPFCYSCLLQTTDDDDVDDDDIDDVGYPVYVKFHPFSGFILYVLFLCIKTNDVKRKILLLSLALYWKKDTSYHFVSKTFIPFFSVCLLKKNFYHQHTLRTLR